MNKQEAIRLGQQRLYELIEDFEETLGLIETMEALGEVPRGDQSLATILKTTTICKAFADRVWGEQAREVMLSAWDGNLLEMINDFWEKVPRDLELRLAAARWANSMEGVSDLRRFWGVKPNEVSTDELSAFQHTLPAEAASTLATSSFRAPLDVIMSARQADYLRLRLRQAAGKGGSLPESESMVAILKRQGVFGKDSEAAMELVKREREYQKQLKMEQEKLRKAQ